MHEELSSTFSSDHCGGSRKLTHNKLAPLMRGTIFEEIFHMRETYKEIHWCKIGSAKLFLDKITDDENGLSIFISTDKERKLIINFDCFYSYRNTDESYRLNAINKLRGMSDASIFISTNSEYLYWFNCESLGIYSKENLKHYIILTSENVIDVVALDEPAVTIVQGVLSI